ncbi:MAG: substrate-binding domain-containing protein [Actinomycetota bacterium]
MKKQRTWLAVVAGLALVMAACAEEQPAGGGGGGGGDSQAPGPGELVTIQGGEEMSGVFIPKATDNPVFDQANDGAVEAAEELGATPASFEGPPNAEDIEGQIQIMTNAVTQGVDAVMISNNAAEQIEPTAQQAQDAGLTVVSWDSPIPSGSEGGESLFVAQVNFDETGEVMADMALDLLGEEGGEFAILSATPDAANQNAWIEDMEAALEDPQYENLELVDTVYGNDDPEDSYDQALALVDQHPDLALIMAPTTVGILAAAEAMQDEDLCGEVLVSGLGLPSDMVEFTQNGCAPEFALWSFTDLGYLTYYATYGIATGQVQAVEGAQFEAGRMGEYTIEADPTRDDGLRIVMGPFTVYTEENVEEG